MLPELSSNLKKFVTSRNEEISSKQVNVRKRNRSSSDDETGCLFEESLSNTPAKQRKVEGSDGFMSTEANQSSFRRRLADWMSWMVEAPCRNKNFFLNSVANMFRNPENSESTEENIPKKHFGREEMSSNKEEELKRSPLRTKNEKPKQLTKLGKYSVPSEISPDSGSSTSTETNKLSPKAKNIPLYKSHMNFNKFEKSQEKYGKSQKYSGWQSGSGKTSWPKSKRNSKIPNKWLTVTAQQSIRLQEREQYRLMLQQYTSEPLFHQVSAWKPRLSFQDACVQNNFNKRSTSKLRDTPAFQMERLDHVAAENLTQSLEKGRKNKPPKLHGSQIQAIFSKSPLNASMSKTNENVKRNSFRKTFSMGSKDNSLLISDIKSPERNCSAMPYYRNCPFFSPKWLEELKLSLTSKCKEREELLLAKERKLQALQEQREAENAAWEEKLKKKLEEAHIAAKMNYEEVDISKDFPELTDEMERLVDDALEPVPPDEVLVEGFRLSITRRDMETLAGLNWLNDEVINFYMNLLMERGKQENFPSVYAFNTFFYPKLAAGGHSALRRWTRKIDIFSYDLLLVPVHLGMHWCLAVVNFQDKKIEYYDSMDGQNGECLKALRTYLQEESLDKKKKEFDIGEWSLEVVEDIPHQMNGSDCGMFTCKYAEYVTRRGKINFTQAHMPYFRRRMVYEITTKKLL
ncbi:sentrin-specific protease 1-like isoform X1 [Tachypleus tridentatus]|uniref:sentrin-specific protease 1-like isoform X1 n=2 Tax=Tachypleus tridentatus TaxID=6853 RepID=UPI003FD5211B